jgi:hypothetical protein
MSINVPNHAVQQYSTNVQVLLQQMGSRLAPAVMSGSHVGNSASPVDQWGAIEANDVTTRFADMPRTDAPNDRRWVHPIDSDINQLVDKFDMLRLLTDPKGVLAHTAVMALGRKKDLRILNAFFGAAKTGITGGTDTAYDTNNEVTVSIGGTNSRINVAKIIAVREKMMANNIDFDMEEAYIGITAKDHSALLNEIQITSSDFTGGDRPVLKDGKVTTFLGFTFIHTELIETQLAGTNKVTLPVWVKSGMHLGQWNDITSSVSQRNDIRGEPWQIYNYMTAGATRLEEKKVYSIVSYR